MAVDIQRLSQVLEASLDPAQNKQGLLPLLTCHCLLHRLIIFVAELAILQEERKSNFSLSLLQIVATEAYGGTARLASALYFKNYVKKHWIVSL